MGAPYRRGQGPSGDAGPYIGDKIASAMKKGGMPAAAATMIRLLHTDYLNDQLAALAWLRQQSFVMPKRIATFGNSLAASKPCSAHNLGDIAPQWTHRARPKAAQSRPQFRNS